MELTVADRTVLDLTRDVNLVVVQLRVERVTRVIRLREKSSCEAQREHTN